MAIAPRACLSVHKTMALFVIIDLGDAGLA